MPQKSTIQFTVLFIVETFIIEKYLTTTIKFLLIRSHEAPSFYGSLTSSFVWYTLRYDIKILKYSMEKLSIGFAPEQKFRFQFLFLTVNCEEIIAKKKETRKRQNWISGSHLQFEVKYMCNEPIVKYLSYRIRQWKNRLKACVRKF